MAIGHIIGRNVRRIRQQAYMSQTTLAERIGCAQTYVGQVERGQRGITVDMLARFAGALAVPIENLMREEVTGDEKSAA